MDSVEDLRAALAEVNAQLSGMSLRAQQLAAMVAQRDREIASLRAQTLPQEEPAVQA